ADDIKPAAEIGERAEDGKVGVRLHGVANQVIERRQRGLQLPKVVRQRALRINIERCAEFPGERFERNTLAMKLSVNIVEIVHRRQLCQRAVRGSTPKDRRYRPWTSLATRIRPPRPMEWWW